METIKLLIIGSGPAGYTAGIYAGRAGLNPVILEGLQPGGQLTITTEVENFPGYPEGVDANEMMDDIRKQAERFGADIRSNIVTKADLDQRPYRFTLDDGSEVAAHSVIIATGASAKFLGLSDEEKYRGVGVSACATCDGFFYRKKVVAVVGGGDTACEEASYLRTSSRRSRRAPLRPAHRRLLPCHRPQAQQRPLRQVAQTRREWLHHDRRCNAAHRR